MKYFFVLFLFTLIFISCGNDKDIPDVSSIKIDLKVERFEQDFFLTDTNHLIKSLQNLQKKYGDFSNDYLNNILGLYSDSLNFPNSQQTVALKIFLKDYYPLKDSVDKIFNDFLKEKNDIIKGLQFVKYYFPLYNIPSTVITFIGPIDAFFETSFGTQGDIITSDAIGIGLQLHMGKDFSFYKSEQGLQLYPEYISKTFTPEYIPVNCMKNIVDDLYHDGSTGRPLIEQMVEQGKRLYLLDKLLPYTPEYLKINYTEQQLKDGYINETVIWDFFLNNDLLNNTEQNIIKNYIGESPKTQELGEDSPGNIGSFTGWQIVKKFMAKNPKLTLQNLMSTPAREIYEQSKYKPKN